MYKVISYILFALVFIFFWFSTNQNQEKTQRNHNSENVLIEAVNKKNTSKIVELIQKGFPLDGKDADGYTALHIAAADGSTEIVLLLIQCGCNVNSLSDFCGSTALMFATANSEWEIVRMLLEANADDTIKDCRGRKAIDFISMWQRKKYNEIKNSRWKKPK